MKAWTGRKRLGTADLWPGHVVVGRSQPPAGSFRSCTSSLLTPRGQPKSLASPSAAICEMTSGMKAMADSYAQLLDATIRHLEGLKERGVRFVSVSPENLAVLAQA